MNYPNLTKIEKPVIVFEIDDCSFRGLARVMRAVDEQRAFGAVKGVVSLGTGAWQGAINPCFVIDLDDWRNLPRAVRDYAANQACFLRLTPFEGIILADMVNHDGWVTQTVGRLWEVELGAVKHAEGYTLLGGHAYVAADATPRGVIGISRAEQLLAGLASPVGKAELDFVLAHAKWKASFDSRGFNSVTYPYDLEKVVNERAEACSTS